MRSITLPTLLLYCMVFDVIGVLGDVGTASSYNPPYLRKYRTLPLVFILIFYSVLTAVGQKHIDYDHNQSLGSVFFN